VYFDYESIFCGSLTLLCLLEHVISQQSTGLDAWASVCGLLNGDSRASRWIRSEAHEAEPSIFPHETRVDTKWAIYGVYDLRQTSSPSSRFANFILNATRALYFLLHSKPFFDSSSLLPSLCLTFHIVSFTQHQPASTLSSRSSIIGIHSTRPPPPNNHSFSYTFPIH
jgi:hypothetical protein